jgi:hypothetical protein
MAAVTEHSDEYKGFTEVKNFFSILRNTEKCNAEIYRVIQEETSILWGVILPVIVRKQNLIRTCV